MLSYRAQIFFLFALSMSAVSASATPLGLDGQWRQTCRVGYERREIFQADQVVFQERNFLDSLCQQEALILESRGTWLDKGPTLRPLDGRAMDFTFTGIYATVLAPDFLENFNAQKICGISDWQIGEAREVSGLSCDFLQTGKPWTVPSAGEQRFGIYKVSAGLLWLGQQTPVHDASSPARRPVDWDKNPYQRF